MSSPALEMCRSPGKHLDISSLEVKSSIHFIKKKKKNTNLYYQGIVGGGINRETGNDDHTTVYEIDH